MNTDYTSFADKNDAEASIEEVAVVDATACEEINTAGLAAIVEEESPSEVEVPVVEVASTCEEVPVTEELPVEEPVHDEAPVSYIARVDIDGVAKLRLRDKPGTDGTVLQMLSDGKLLTVIDAVNSEWLHVEVEDDENPTLVQSGYVKKIYVTEA